MTLELITNGILILIIILGLSIKRCRRIGFAFLLFFLSNLGMFIIENLIGFNISRHQSWQIWETALFLTVFVANVSFTYWLARKIDIIPPFSFKYFRVGKMAAAIGIVYGSNVVLNIVYAAYLQLIHSSASLVPANQAGLNAMINYIPYALLAIPIVFAGFFEELTYRVGVFELLFPKHPKVAFAFSALIFAFLHVSAGSLLDWHAWLSYGVMAVVFTWTYYKWRNYYLNLSIHATYNFIGVLVTALLLLSQHG